MNKKYFTILLLVSLLVVAITVGAGAAPDAGNSGGAADENSAGMPDDLPHPLGEKQRALRQEALSQIMKGNISPEGPVVEVAHGQFVELAREDEDLIWTVLADFGNQEHPDYTGGLLGPQHNQIPQPDRNYDNTTIWVPDFNLEYYLDLLFSEEPGANSMRNYYIEQSSNRYTVGGDVTDWVQVPYNTARYGRSFADTWYFVDDSVDYWYQSQLDAGKSAAEIDEYLSQFDVWDRYDWDGDGNFDEPDGYIDHFQSVHAGEGEEAGGGIYGADAIWSHRWYVQLVPIGSGGPTLDDGSVVPFGGTQIGGSKYWIGDYTAEPENGGVGVFAHEFAHDLGLPDLYNTSGGGAAAENSTAFWWLMSSGSWLGEGTVDIGSKPGHLSNWSKFQLGWLNYEVAFAGQKSEHKLGPAETNTKQAQGLFVVLPDKEVTEQIADPYSGDYFYYSGSGNDLDNIMSRTVTLPAGNPSLTAMVNYEIETDWDYAYVTVNGAPVETDHSTNTNPNGQNFGFGITDFSGGWVPLTADLTAFAGQTVDIGFWYWTDGATVEAGFMVDDIQISGQPLDDAESDFGWTFDGFRLTTGSETASYFNAYVAEFRQYRWYDDGLRVGPYNFGFQDNPMLGNYVEHFSYQDGLLISYWDTSQSDNNTRVHPGAGLILPIDAHPENMIRADGGDWRGRIQAYDSTFGLEATDALELHWNSAPSEHASQPAVPVFDDNIQYWNPETPVLGVINPHTGTQIRVKSVSAQGSFMQVEVRPSK
ncbi:MAG: immune inhibitor A domain-containing protein [Anaerolineales bacterium]|jgi:immune inhibitor A